MHHLVEPILDGSLAAWFPRGTARALSSWLGLLLLAATGVGALALDATSRPVAERASGGPGGAVLPVGARRALLVATVACAVGAAVATLVRFSLALS
ncbi:hypothetical protein ACFEMC_08035 [Kineococcus sp. DHX-1]|uniref:hypothetical protein n=1 Tax=Kineococcus sp. DHX-1 TaxID=3349638 RepID=UPI0036D276CF